jgi:nucleoside-diphosphate-sugar epimerase
MHDVAPSVVFNLAGYGVAHDERDEATALRLNVDLVRELALACVPPRGGGHAPRLIHAGSAAEYGATHGVLDEARVDPPTSLYGAAKLTGTAALTELSREHGAHALCARLFTVVGDGEHAGRLLPTLRAAALGQAGIPLSAGTQERDFAWVGDVARALVDLATAPWAPGAVVNIGSGRMHTVRAFVEAAARELHIAPSRLHFGAVPSLPGDGTGVTVPLQRMQHLLGYTLPRDLTQVVRSALSAW